MKKSTSIGLLLVIILLSFSLQSEAFSSYILNYGLGISFSRNFSFSQMNTGLPLRMGYPTFESSSIILHGFVSQAGDNFKTKLYLKTTLPTKLTANDGNGLNYLLDEDKSTYLKTEIGLEALSEHYLTVNTDWLREGSELKLIPGAAVSVFWEKRTLEYLSGQREKKSEINAGIGPISNLSLNVTDKLDLNFGWKTLFYLPYISKGSYLSLNEAGTEYTSKYYDFIVENNYDYFLNYDISDDSKVRLGYNLKITTGFGNEHPSFTMDNLITSKLDLNKNLYLSYEFSY